MQPGMRKITAAITTLAASISLAGAFWAKAEHHEVKLLTGDPFGTPVAVAPTSSGRLLLADYAGVFVFDRSTGRVTRLTVTGADHFNPTDLTVDGDSVFIANYHGNNLLEARVDENKNTLTIIAKVAAPNTISPEGVAWDGKRLAAANYDASNVQIFVRETDGWKLTCELPVSYAHGVAFNDGKLFATSLGDRQVLKIDPDECRVEMRSGAQGWAPGQYLWPTSVAAMGGRIVVADAHTGRVTFLSAKNLQTLGVTGGNGPGVTGLNMPYDATPAGDTLWVTSTFNRRLLSYDTTSGEVLESWGFDRGWAEEAPSGALMTEQGYDGYIRKSASFQLRGKCYHTGYARLHECEDGTKSFELPSDIDGGQLYFIQAVRGARGVFLTSPQHVFAMYFADGGGSWQKVRVERDRWVIGDRLVGPEGVVDLRTIEPNFVPPSGDMVHSAADIGLAIRVLERRASDGFSAE
jgi:DNA-binding beta-propeller fold protein YncE